jgi:hypothetical protein
MVKALETKLGHPLHLPPDGLGQLNGAFGAALLGLRRVERLRTEGRAILAPSGDAVAGGAAARRWSTFVSGEKGAQAIAAVMPRSLPPLQGGETVSLEKGDRL